MAYTELKQDDICLITKQTFEKAIFLAYRDGITSLAPLGYSGESVILFGSQANGRQSLISIRNHSGNPELLITDTHGAFLFYGKYDINLGVDFISEQYWQIFNLMKDKVEKKLMKTSSFADIDFSPNLELSEGFSIMKAYQDLIKESLPQ